MLEGLSMRRSLRRFTAAAVALTALAQPGPAGSSTPSDEGEARGRLPGVNAPFVANQGQVDERVAYYARTPAGTLFVTHQGQVVHALSAPRIDPRRDARPAPGAAGWSLTETPLGGRPRPAGRDRSRTHVSSFLGGDPARWSSSLPAWEQVSLGEVWPGVGVTLQAHSGEKVFTVSPGGEVSRIRMRVDGARSLEVNADGALVADTGLGPVTFTAPIAYQERGGVRHPVAVAYHLRGSEYGFSVGALDPALPLVIDPYVQATYLGGGGDESLVATAIHPTTGEVYVAGSTASDPFPGTAGGAQPASGGGARDAFVARFSSDLTTLVQATYLGGAEIDDAQAITVHPTSGDVLVAGRTRSNPFPGTAGGAQPAYGGHPPGFPDAGDAFVARFPSSLTSLTQSTYLGSSGGEFAFAIAIHPATSDVYVAGVGTIPGTAGGAQPVFGGGMTDGFVARLDGTLTSLVQGTFLGGSLIDTVHALAIHPASGDVYVAGYTGSTDFPTTAGAAQPTFGGSNIDAFVTRLSSTLTSFVESSYLGGTSFDEAQALAIHGATGDIYVTGNTGSTDFPGTAGGAQPTGGRFVTRLPATLTAITQSTFLGGGARALAIHPATGDVYVGGDASSGGVPGTAGGAQPAFGGGNRDAFVARLPATLTSLTQATYAGGCGDEIGWALAIHPTSGDVYVAGSTTSDNFPLTGGGAQSALGGGYDGFVARLTSGLDAPPPGAAGSACPDLRVAKTHSGNFAQGSTGNTYAVTVRNDGLGDQTAGHTVTVTDAPPPGLTVTAMSGTGWTCTTLPTCTRIDPLAAGASFPPITVIVDVAANATTPQVNSVSVSTTQSETNAVNNSASDSTTIVAAPGPAPDLTITKTHSGDFVQGSTGTYTVTVTNGGNGSKAAGQTVTVTDFASPGLTITAMSGTGWTCNSFGFFTCTRSDALAAGTSYPAITVTASVAPDATSPQDNVVFVSSPQPESDPDDNGAVDTTVITTGVAAPAIPTLSEWAIAALALLFAALALLHLRGRAV
jgi:uncharacterized repeat protein (TIGR01451 family)